MRTKRPRLIALSTLLFASHGIASQAAAQRLEAEDVGLTQRAVTSSIHVKDQDGDGNVELGIGTDAPTQSIDVREANPQVWVESTASTNAERTLFRLKNNGKVSFFMVDSSASTWKFLSGPSFEISLVGTGVTELKLKPNGNLQITGVFQDGSDRDTKNILSRVDPDSVLETLTRVPISTWVRRGHADAGKHMGPMAQDFYAAFGLGDDERSIAMLDLAGANTAAIQALNAANQHLRAENGALLERIERLEQMVTEIAFDRSERSRVEPAGLLAQGEDGGSFDQALMPRGAEH